MINRRVFSRIEYHFYNYHTMLHEYRESVEDIIMGSPLPPDGMPRGCDISDPTGAKMLKLANETDTVKWLSVIEELLAHYEKIGRHEYIKLIQLKYFNKSKFKKSPYQISRELCCSRKTYYNWREQIIYDAALKAATKGLVRF